MTPPTPAQIAVATRIAEEVFAGSKPDDLRHAFVAILSARLAQALADQAAAQEQTERRYNAIREHLLRRHGCDFGEPDSNFENPSEILWSESDDAEVKAAQAKYAHRLQAAEAALTEARAEIARLSAQETRDERV